MEAKGRFFWTEKGEIIFAGEDVSTGEECTVSVELPLKTVVLFASSSCSAISIRQDDVSMTWEAEWPVKQEADDFWAFFDFVTNEWRKTFKTKKGA